MVNGVKTRQTVVFDAFFFLFDAFFSPLTV